MPTISKDPAVIRYYDRTGGEQVQARLDPYKGREYFSIRTWYMDQSTGELKPARNGINLPVDEKSDFLRLVVALFPDDVQLIQKVES